MHAAAGRGPHGVGITTCQQAAGERPKHCAPAFPACRPGMSHWPTSRELSDHESTVYRTGYKQRRYPSRSSRDFEGRAGHWCRDGRPAHIGAVTGWGARARARARGRNTRFFYGLFKHKKKAQQKDFSVFYFYDSRVHGRFVNRECAVARRLLVVTAA